MCPLLTIFITAICSLNYCKTFLMVVPASTIMAKVNSSQNSQSEPFKMKECGLFFSAPNHSMVSWSLRVKDKASQSHVWCGSHCYFDFSSYSLLAHSISATIMFLLVLFPGTFLFQIPSYFSPFYFFNLYSKFNLPIKTFLISLLSPSHVLFVLPAFSS